MKKLCIIFCLLFIIILTAAVFCSERDKGSAGGTEYFRIHIRADSDSKEDQAVKYLVKDVVVEYLTPVIASASSKNQAIEKISASLEEIESLCDEVLFSEGLCYSSSAAVKREQFPTRVYENVTLPSGEYDSLIINLGSGSGDNWWCVIYPPLCFSGGENVEYKSKIKELIDKFRNT